MSEKQQEKIGPESLLETWMKSSTEFLGSMVQMWPDVSEISGTSNTSKKGEKNRAQESWESTLKTWQALSSVMSKPGTSDSLFKGINSLPDILSKMVKTGWDGFFQTQQQWLERTGKVGKSAEAYTFENLDQDAFNAWTELYEKDFRQFLNIPQLGLTRFYQERMNLAADKFNLFQASIAEFTHLLYLPMEKSFKVMQDKFTELSDEGKLSDPPKVYYRMWVKILEGHYMILFKSPEYTKTMAKVLDAMGEYTVARQEVLQDVLQSLPVPSQKDMDELYKEIYLLKKKAKELEKRQYKN